jgi:TrmH family RNA methyltransferase
LIHNRDMLHPERFHVILSRPDSPENIGLAARAMKNTGFSSLRLIMDKPLRFGATVTAVHAHDILENAERFPDIEQAIKDVDVVFAAAARPRKNFPGMSLSGLISTIETFTPSTRIGLLFGSERTGLTSGELRHSNYRVALPQASPQPSYNLASAVLLILFYLSFHNREIHTIFSPFKPLPRREQEECIALILDKLAGKGFIHAGNKEHISDRIYDLFGRLAMTDSDRKLLLAVFSNLR